MHEWLRCMRVFLVIDSFRIVLADIRTCWEAVIHTVKNETVIFTVKKQQLRLPELYP